MAALCTIQHLPAKIDTQIQLLSSTPPKSLLHRSTCTQFNPKIRFKICCTNNDETPNQTIDVVQQPIGFSMLEPNPPWESGRVWSTMGLYFFNLHIPMSFGGLSIVANLLHQNDIEPQFKAVAVLLIETLELVCALLLLQFTAKHKPVRFIQLDKIESDRNWIFSAVLGFIVLVLAMFFTSLVTSIFDGTKGTSDQTVKEILLSGSVAQTACTLVYCVVAPLLEEIVYRRFLLTALAPSMQWYQAVIISSVIFSAAHLSGENFIQLVIIGMVLGCTYCWTGDIRSSILLHSVYNALTLLQAVLA